MSFKAYPSAWALHEAMRAATARWHRQQLLTEAQRTAIDAAYPLDFYRPAWLLRVVLFVFTVLGCATALGLVVLLLMNINDERAIVVITCLLGTVGSLLALELVIHQARPYHAGYDNALLYSALLYALALGYYAMLSSNAFAHLLSPLIASPWLVYALALFTVATMRYGDGGTAGAGFACYLLFFISLALPFGWGRALLPFMLMLAAIGAGAGVRYFARRPDYFYYRTCLQTVKALALVTFYVAGNYLVVRESNAALSNAVASAQLPFTPLFYFFTAAIPLAYLYYGLRRSDRLVLIIGLLAAAFSVYTVRYYHAVLPPAVGAALAGAMLLGGAIAALWYLRVPRHGLSAAADDAAAPFINLESLVIAQHHVSAAPAASFEFGGGQSGGGGANGQW